MLDALARMSNQIPPRLKALLNLAISICLFFLAIPLLWTATLTGSWADWSLGAGVVLLGIFNLFT
ncbi:MAG TPA: hypothetical protein VNZ52_09245 [Candidatus Thermoplasmatota archaeon]|nr:hypothetical protein [Candidatus Thermoplasmatota archaeon]